MINGVSVVANETIFDKLNGVSIIANETIFDKLNGVSVVSGNNVFIEICDVNDNPVNANLDISGGSDVDGSYSGFNQYPFTTGEYNDISFTASLTGYTTASVIVNVGLLGFQVIKIVIEEVVIALGCRTFPINSSGAEISRIIPSGRIRVEFNVPVNIDLSEWTVVIEAYELGSDKRSVIEIGHDFISLDTGLLIYDFDPVNSDFSYCYTPKIELKQCP